MPKRYMLTLLIIAVIFFGGIFLIINLSSKRNNANTTSNQPAATKQTRTLSGNATKVSYTTYGEVVGEESRRAIRITVTDTDRKIEILQGYDESVIDSKVYPNKSSAFKDFLLALETSNFSLRDTAIKVDDRGLCPLGNRYVYEAEYNEGDAIRSWSTTCSTKNASFKGNFKSVDALFKAQITNYSDITSDVQL